MNYELLILNYFGAHCTNVHGYFLFSSPYVRGRLIGKYCAHLCILMD